MLGERLVHLRDALWSGADSNVLWVGAGYSALVAQLPSWREFLMDAANLIADNDEKAFAIAMVSQGRLRLGAEHIADQLGFNLQRLLRSKFAHVGRPSALIDPRWATTIVTTNYDLLLDHQFGMFARVSARNPDDLFNPGSKLVKIHGSIDDPETCVVSIKHYTRAYDATLEWFLFFLFQSRSVVFVGTSLDRSEPWVPILAKLRRVYPVKNLGPPHYALLAVPSNQEANERGKEMARDFGIVVIPYIPDHNAAAPHSVVHDIMQYLRKEPEGQLRCEDHVLRQAEELFRGESEARDKGRGTSANFVERRDNIALGAVEWVIERGKLGAQDSARCRDLTMNVLFDLLGAEQLIRLEEFNDTTVRMQRVVMKLTWSDLSQLLKLSKPVAKLQKERPEIASILAPLCSFLRLELETRTKNLSASDPRRTKAASLVGDLQ
jgi:hypothetical protein